MSKRVLFMSTNELNFIQEVLDRYSKAKPDFRGSCWRIIKNIDEQCGGSYPKNYNW